MEDKESVYDEQIFPLMGQIIEIAREHGIPMLASFQLNDGDHADPPDPLMCSTILLPEGCSEDLKQAAHIINPPVYAVALTVRQVSEEGT